MWPVYALLAMICFASMQLVFRYTTRGGLTPAVVLFFVFGFAWSCYLLHLATFRPPIPLTLPRTTWLLLAGALAYVGNLYAVKAVSLAPNPGYAMALVSLQALVVTGVSVVVLDATLSWTKLLGVMLCAIGVTLLVL